MGSHDPLEIHLKATMLKVSSKTCMIISLIICIVDAGRGSGRLTSIEQRAGMHASRKPKSASGRACGVKVFHPKAPASSRLQYAQLYINEPGNLAVPKQPSAPKPKVPWSKMVGSKTGWRTLGKGRNSKQTA